MLRKTTIKTSVFACFFFLFQSLSASFLLANEVDTKNDKVVTDLRKGDKAPYDGILLTARMAAEIKENCNPAVSKQKCDILVKEAVDLSLSECKKNTDILQSKYDAFQVKHDKVVSAKDKEIQDLRDLLKPAPWYESPKLWFGVGVVTGAAVIITLVKNTNL